MTAEAPVRVVGLGNVLMQDDGFGPWVIHVLESLYDFPAGVSLLDAGTPGLDLVPHLYGAEHLILVDTVRSEGAPGTIRLYRREDLLRHAPDARTNAHDPGVKETLLALDFRGIGIEDVLLVGAIAGAAGQGNELTGAVRAAIPAAAEAVLAELASLGLAARRNALAEPPLPWWAAQP